jgi:hypothetical protein
MGLASVTAFMGLPADNPILSIIPREGVEVKTLEQIQVQQLLNIAELQYLVDQMHKEIPDVADRVRQKAIHTHNAIRNVQAVNFEISDNVLVGTVQREKLPKLVVTWQGPYRAVRFESEQVLEVENLLNGKRKCVHCTRVKLWELLKS